MLHLPQILKFSLFLPTGFLKEIAGISKLVEDETFTLFIRFKNKVEWNNTELDEIITYITFRWGFTSHLVSKHFNTTFYLFMPT